jgi:hypothetical protein
VKPWILGVALILTACGGSAPVSHYSPRPSAPASSSAGRSVSPASPAGPFAVLSGTVAGDAAHYTVSLVGADGQVAATVKAASGGSETVPFPGTAGQAACCAPDAWMAAVGDSVQARPLGTCCGVDLPSVSASASRVYLLDGETAVRFLASDGSTGIATYVPNVRGRARAVFSVSPDDSRIAVSVFNWSTAPIRLQIYVEDLAGAGHHVQIFSSNTKYEWPAGWHAGALVLAVDPIFGGAPNPFAATAYHLVNPDTGLRLATIGSTACPVVGPLTGEGTACAGQCGTTPCVMSVAWTGIATPIYKYRTQNTGANPAALSPDGGAVAVRESGPPSGDGVAKKDGTWIPVPELVWAPFWIDSQRVLVHASVGNQPICNSGVGLMPGGF